MKDYSAFFRSKTVYLMGLGLQGGGVGVAEFLLPLAKKVIVSDLNADIVVPQSIQDLCLLDLGQHSPQLIKQADLVIPNPAIAFDSPHLLFAQKHCQVLGESALFAQFCPLPIIGITGTRGKTTTTMLIYEILNRAYPKQIILGGNLPQQPSLPLLKQINSSSKYVVLELSSFQLHYWHQVKISPHIGVWTNLYPDHLDRYSSLDEYAQDKQAIFQYQTSSDFSLKFPPADDLPSDWSLKIPGQHNRANAAAAWQVAAYLQLPDSLSRSVMASFPGVPYRLQTIALKHGVTYINDTTSTTPTACIKAIQATEPQPTILILGGSDKKLPLKALIQTIKSSPHLKKIVLLYGDGTNQIKPYLPADLISPIFSDFSSALDLAVQTAQPGDTVLLSPGFASFSMFNNEFHRGDLFNQYVHQIPT